MSKEVYEEAHKHLVNLNRSHSIMQANHTWTQSVIYTPNMTNDWALALMPQIKAHQQATLQAMEANKVAAIRVIEVDHMLKRSQAAW